MLPHQQAGEMGWRKLHEIQQREVPNSVTVLQAQTENRSWCFRKWLSRKRPGSPDGPNIPPTRIMVSWAALRTVLLRGWGQWHLPSVLMRPPQDSCSGPSSTTIKWRYWAESRDQKFIMNTRKHFLMCEWHSPGTGCKDMWWSLRCWLSSKAPWTWSWATDSFWPAWAGAMAKVTCRGLFQP